MRIRYKGNFRNERCKSFIHVPWSTKWIHNKLFQKTMAFKRNSVTDWREELFQ